MATHGKCGRHAALTILALAIFWLAPPKRPWRGFLTKNWHTNLFLKLSPLPLSSPIPYATRLKTYLFILQSLKRLNPELV